jgi:hypothetical protein
VYWRRRAVLLGAAAILVLLTAWVLRPGRPDKPLGKTAGSTQRSSASNHPSTPQHGRTTTTATTTATHSRTASATFPPCAIGSLKIAAVTSALTYNVGDQPVVMLQVTNTGPNDCTQDLADRQVELRIYNGESRVWGSHDCEVQPGSNPRVLTMGQAVRISITWSGLSSQPNCTGTRQRVGAGTYTLYARLSGHEGAAAQFAIN